MQRSPVRFIQQPTQLAPERFGVNFPKGLYFRIMGRVPCFDTIEDPFQKLGPIHFYSEAGALPILA